MKLHEEFKLWENMWEQPLKEDNIADLKKGIKAEIAEYEAEKAADPDNAWDYDKKIKAAKAELAELNRKYPTPAIAKKQELAAQKAQTVKNINYALYYTFSKNNKELNNKFGCPSYESVYGKGWFITVSRVLDQQAIKEFEDACATVGIKAKFSGTHEIKYGHYKIKTLFSVDLNNLKLPDIRKLRYGILEENVASTEEALYNSVRSCVDTCIMQLKLDRACTDSYDNSDGDEGYYELQWNFSNLPNQSKVETAIATALAEIENDFGVEIGFTIDDEILADEGLINLVVSYELDSELNESVNRLFKLYETMWQEPETTKTNNSLENLKAALIDSFSAKGYTDEVTILNKCTLKDATEIKSHTADGYEIPVVMLTTDNMLYLHPALAEPQNFDKASLAVRIEFAYRILGINLGNKNDFADVRSGLAAIRARLTKSEIALAKNFVLDGKQYVPIRFYSTRKARERN